MFMSLARRKCLVVGGGRIAAGKIDGLMEHGAEVVVVSPRAVKAINEHAQAGALHWRRRVFAASDLDGAFLVVAATNSQATNETVFRTSTARGVLCNSVDDPEHCDFFYPSIVRRGPLQIAISTGGRSPALAARLRRELEKQFGPEWGEWVDYLGAQRDDLHESKISAEARKKLLLQLATPKAFRAFQRRQNSLIAKQKGGPASR